MEQMLTKKTMKASGILLSLCLTCHLVDIGEGSSLTRCQVYRLTQIYNMPGNAADWVCLAKHGSNYRTHEHLSTPSVTAHGLLAIDTSYCRDHKRANSTACGTTLCTELEDNAVSDDLNCGKLIHATSGFNAWPKWVDHCSGQDLTSYIQNC